MKSVDKKPTFSGFLVGILIALPLFLVTTIPAFVGSLGFKFQENGDRLDLPNFLLQLAASPSGKVSLATFLTVYLALILLLIFMLFAVAWIITIATKKFAGTSIQFSGFLQPPKRIACLGLVLGAGVFSNVYFKPVGQLVEYLAGTSHTAPSADSFLPVVCNSLGAVSLSSIFASIISVIVVPCCEELCFRGYLYGLLSSRLSSLWVCLTTSALFSIGHFGSHPFGITYFANIFFVGTFYFLARKISGGIWWPILCHAAVNLVAPIVCI
jgi:membrane protease YdiL (CAAX protease family)